MWEVWNCGVFYERLYVILVWTKEFCGIRMGGGGGGGH